MKRGWKIVLISLSWAVLVAFFVWAAILRSRNETARRVERLQVVVSDADRLGLVTPATMSNYITAAGLNPVGKAVDSVDLADINSLVENYCFTASAKTYINYSGSLTVRLTQRNPVVRISTDRGDEFYLTADGYILPVQRHTAIYLPIVSGDFTPPFPRNFTGNMKQWAAENKKNSDKNYIFLCKLINFVFLAENDKATKGEIVQMTVSSPNGNQEPEIEIVPREGNYTVRLGTLDDCRKKLKHWKRFAESGAVDLEGGVLNLKYDNQALWSPAAAKTKKVK